MKKVIRREVIGIQPVFSTNVEIIGNYISDGNIINKNCVVDETYTGECHLHLTNTGNCDITISAGDKIVQGVLIPMNYCVPEEVENEKVLFAGTESARGCGGFGSTGTK